jgi:hypothetical protein
LAATFAAYDAAAGATGTDELMGSAITADDSDLPRLLFVPTVLLTLFAMPQSPRAALRKIEALAAAMPAVERQLFDRTTNFLRASCVKKGGNGSTCEYSWMGTMWTLAPSQSRLFGRWQRDTMRSLYADALAGAHSMGVGGGAEAFGASMGTATNSAMEKLGDQLKGARAQERREDEHEKTKKSKWSELSQNRILRCHGTK